MTPPATALPPRRYMRIGTPTPIEFMRLTPPANTTTALTPEPHQFSRLRAAGGAAIGATVPISTFVVGHTVPLEQTAQSLVLWAAVLGGLVFSAGTVNKYCTRLFQGAKWKAASFCVLAETIMTFAPDWLWPLSVAMLCILVACNAVETGRVAGNASTK